MQNKLFYISIIFGFMMSSCNAQNRIDITAISFDSTTVQVKEKPQMDDETCSFFTRTSYEYRNVEAFCFNDFKFKNGGTPYNAIRLILNKQQDGIVCIEISIYDTQETERFFNFLEKKYGNPIILQSATLRNGKLVGGAYYLWIDVVPNHSIFFAKHSNLSENGEIESGVTVYYVKTEDSDRFTSAGLEVNAFEYVLLSCSYKASDAADRRDGYGPNLERFKAYVKSLR